MSPGSGLRGVAQVYSQLAQPSTLALARSSKGIDEWIPGGAADSLDECKRSAVTAASNSVRIYRTQDDKGTTLTQTGPAKCRVHPGHPRALGQCRRGEGKQTEQREQDAASRQHVGAVGGDQH